MLRVGRGRSAFRPIAVQSWTPAQLQTGSRVFAWWALNETASILQNDGTPVTTAGQPIASMSSLEGGNRWFKGNNNDAKRATYQIDANGYAYASFDGVDDVYDLGGEAPIVTFGAAMEGLAAFAVMPTTTNQQGIYARRGDPVINPQIGIDGGKYYIQVRDQASVLRAAYATSVPSTTQPQIVMGYRQSDTMHIVIDGVTEASTAGALGPLTDESSSSTLGYVPATYWGGRKYAWLILRGPTTAEERANIISWLGRQCGRAL